MSTNYYLIDESCKCEHCGRGTEIFHIGKSSKGWCFALHVIPERGIYKIEDWIKLFFNKDNYIINEYEERLNPVEMLTIIFDRKDNNWNFSVEEDEMLKRNYGERGPNNLIRHKINEGHCIGHGEGPYDYIIGEFS